MTHLLLAVGFAIGVTLSIPTIEYLAEPGVTWGAWPAEDLMWGQFRQPDAVVRLEGFEPVATGFILPARTDGTLSYRIDKNPGDDLALVLWMYTMPPLVEGSVAASADGGPSVEFLSNPNLDGGVADVPIARSASSVVLTFHASNASDKDFFVLNQIGWGRHAGVPAPRPPRTSDVGVGVVFACIAASLMSKGKWRWYGAAVFGMTMLYAVGTRISALAAVGAGPLDPDAVGYRAFGEAFNWWPLWDHGIVSADFGAREPFFPLVAHAVFDLVGSTDFHLRVASTVFSILTVAVAVPAARRRLSLFGALAVGALLAWNTNLISEGPRGLRTEVEMFLLLLLYWAFESKWTAQGRNVLTGIIGAALVLTRTFYLPVVIVGAAISSVARTRGLKHAALAALVILALPLAAEAAFRASMYDRQGSASYDTDLSARAYANDEKFWYHRDLPRPDLFQSVEEYERTGCCAGPRITYSQYLFELHSVQDVIRDTILGYWDVLRDIGGACPMCSALKKSVLVTLGQVVDGAVRVLGVIGLGLLTLRSRRDVNSLLLPAMVFGGLSFSTFLYHRQLMEPVRNVIVIYPFLVIAAVWAVERGMQMVAKRYAVAGGVGTRPTGS